jgi:hypothetical protein
MSSFTTPLIIRVEQRERSGRGVFTVQLPFIYEIGCEGSGKEIIVPKGFETDFASIPRIARLFISPVGLHAKAALVHDLLYSNRNHTMTRLQADNVFLEAMGVLKVPLFRRTAIYLAVCSFGWIAWRKNKPKT